MIQLKFNILILAVGLCGAILPASADDFEEERKKIMAEFEQFRSDALRELDEFREQINKEYAEALANPWEKIKVDPVIPAPTEPEPEPPVWEEDGDDNFIDSPSPIPIKEVINPPAPAPQPEPVKPIVPIVAPNPVKTEISFYGTPIQLTEPDWRNFSLPSTDESGVSSAWQRLSSLESSGFISDLLQARKKISIPDWGFLKLVDQAATEYATAGSSTHSLLMAYVLSQCGYKVRMVRSDGALKLYFACNGILYDHVSIDIDGTKYWSYAKSVPGMVNISNVAFPGEKSMSLSIPYSPKFKYSPGQRRQVKVKDFPDVNLDVTVNKNLIDFYNEFPAGTLDSSPYTRWVNIARTPASREVERQLYTKLQTCVAGKNQKDAVNFLLKVAQSFPYGYDDEIWGDDRAFWLEESWHYPKSDCEDHAIHFVKLVNAILGLDVAVVYHPGHLYSAVATTDGSLSGDYFLYNGKKFYVCDPTCFYAPAGVTAKEMDNAKATIIPIQ